MIANFTVLFRLEAGPQIGIGHLQRCLSLATALRRSGAKCVFLTNADPIVQDRVADARFEAKPVGTSEPGTSEDLSIVLEIVARYAAKVIVVDSYKVGANYLKGLCEAGLVVVAIDDLAAHSFPCHMVINGTARAHELPYVMALANTRYLLGPSYLMLRPEFWDIPIRRPRGSVENILVTLGGTDSHNLTPRLLAKLDDLSPNFSVTAIIGPFFQNQKQIETMAKRCRPPVRLVEAPDTVRALMLEADLAISAGGQTLYELAATGTPTVAIQVADNQSFNSRALEAEGTLRCAGSADDAALIERVGAAVRELMCDVNARERMAQAGQRLVDGKGSLRLADEIAALSS